VHSLVQVGDEVEEELVGDRLILSGGAEYMFPIESRRGADAP